MADSKTESKTKRDKYLWKHYRWTSEQYDALFKLQGGRCAICGREPIKAPLNVDHEHFRIETKRNTKKLWNAHAVFADESKECGVWDVKTKVEAVRLVNGIALPLSVRGLLCPGRHGKAGHGCCNRLLGRVDNVEWLKSVIKYLENPPAKQLDKSNKLD